MLAGRPADIGAQHKGQCRQENLAIPPKHRAACFDLASRIVRLPPKVCFFRSGGYLLRTELPDDLSRMPRER